MSKPSIHDDGHHITFVAKIVPGSSKTAVVGVLDDTIKIKVAAPPEKGKANKCLIAFLAGQLGVRKDCIRITAGQTSPVKHVQVIGISTAFLRERLGLSKQGS
jgi:uncharacterized protein (TIGR00251 family)